VLGLSEDVDELVKESLEHLKTYSWFLDDTAKIINKW
jgi:hypothetical protein